MASIATLYAEVLPETSKIAAGLTAAFRKVDPEAREAGRRWGREIQQGLGEAKVELKADTAKAKAEIEAAAKDKKATVEVDADTAKAEAQIDVAARDRKATIEVNADTLISSVQRSVSGMAPAMAGAGTQLSTSLASGGASAATSVGGSLSGVMGPVGTALTVALVGGAVTAAAGVAAALTGALGLIPAGLGGGVAVLGTLVTGLDGVKDAWDAAGKAADSATKDQAEKAKAVASAQKTLRDAVLDEANAQKDVANARKDARQQLEDLNVQLRGGVIDEKSAILDAQAARRDLATGRFKDSIEYQQAQLRVQQADQRVLEAHERNVQLQDKATDANAKGVTQSDQVVAANQRLAKAHDDVATAQKNLADTKTKPSSEAEALSIAMGKLSPSAMAFIGTLEALKPAWTQLKFAVQDSLFAGIGPQLQSLATQYLPVLKTAMTGLAGTMNTAFKDVGAWLSKPETMATIQQIVANIGSSFQEWAKSIVPFSQAFLTITQVGAGFLPSLAKVITDGANAFNNFIQQAAKSGELQQWMRVGIEAVAQLMKMLPVLGKMFLDLAPLAVPFLQVLNQLLPAIEPVFRAMGVIGERFFTGFAKGINTGMKMLGQLVDVLKNIGDVFGRVWNAISGAIDKAWKVIKPILEAFKAALSLLNPGDILGKIGQFLGRDNTVSGTPKAASSGASPSTPSPSSSGSLGGGGQFGAPSSTGPLYGAADAGAAASAVAGAPGAFDWDAVAKAEAGGNWADADTGHNGHYGGLQFAPDTWAMYGGLKFASRPDLATPEQQKIIANRTAFTGWNGTPPQGLGAWESITKGSVPGISTGSTPSALPSAGAGSAPSGVMPSIPGAGMPGILHDEGGLHSQAAAVNAAGILAQMFPQLTNIGGAHPDSMPYHPEGRALDVMIPGGSTMGGANPEGKALGDQIKAWALQNAQALGLEDTIWQDFWQPPGGQGNSLGRASQGPTQGHFDHVHLTFKPGAVPDPNSMYPSAAGMPTIASPQGVSPSGVPLGTQQSPMYVMPAQGGSGQQLGQDMVSGVMEMFGFDGSLFKNPMDTGLFKGFKGLMGFLTGGAGRGQQGAPASAFQGGGMPAMGGGGDMLSGLGSMLTGSIPQPFGQVTRGGPMQAPDEYQPMLPGSGGNTGMPSNFLAPARGETPTGGGHKIDQSINFNGPVGNPQAAGDMATGLNVPRARQGLTGLPK